MHFRPDTFRPLQVRQVCAVGARSVRDISTGVQASATCLATATYAEPASHGDSPDDARLPPWIVRAQVRRITLLTDFSCKPFVR
jgi:hypothetical protein